MIKITTPWAGGGRQLYPRPDDPSVSEGESAGNPTSCCRERMALVVFSSGLDLGSSRSSTEPFGALQAAISPYCTGRSFNGLL